jgi:hypothetical protein
VSVWELRQAIESAIPAWVAVAAAVVILVLAIVIVLVTAPRARHE